MLLLPLPLSPSLPHPLSLCVLHKLTCRLSRPAAAAATASASACHVAPEASYTRSAFPSYHSCPPPGLPRPCSCRFLLLLAWTNLNLHDSRTLITPCRLQSPTFSPAPPPTDPTCNAFSINQNMPTNRMTFRMFLALSHSHTSPSRSHFEFGPTLTVHLRRRHKNPPRKAQ